MSISVILESEIYIKWMKGQIHIPLKKFDLYEESDKRVDDESGELIIRRITEEAENDRNIILKAAKIEKNINVAKAKKMVIE